MPNIIRPLTADFIVKKDFNSLTDAERRLKAKFIECNIAYSFQFITADLVILGDSLESNIHIIGKYKPNRKIELYTTEENYIERNFFT